MNGMCFFEPSGLKELVERIKQPGVTFESIIEDQMVIHFTRTMYSQLVTELVQYLTRDEHIDRLFELILTHVPIDGVLVKKKTITNSLLLVISSRFVFDEMYRKNRIVPQIINFLYSERIRDEKLCGRFSSFFCGCCVFTNCAIIKDINNFNDFDSIPGLDASSFLPFRSLLIKNMRISALKVIFTFIVDTFDSTGEILYNDETFIEITNLLKDCNEPYFPLMCMRSLVFRHMANNQARNLRLMQDRDNCLFKKGFPRRALNDIFDYIGRDDISDFTKLQCFNILHDIGFGWEGTDYEIAFREFVDEKSKDVMLTKLPPNVLGFALKTFYTSDHPTLMRIFDVGNISQLNIGLFRSIMRLSLDELKKFVFDNNVYQKLIQVQKGNYNPFIRELYLYLEKELGTDDGFAKVREYLTSQVFTQSQDDIAAYSNTMKSGFMYHVSSSDYYYNEESTSDEDGDTDTKETSNKTVKKKSEEEEDSDETFDTDSSDDVSIENDENEGDVETLEVSKDESRGVSDVDATLSKTEENNS